MSRMSIDVYERPQTPVYKIPAETPEYRFGGDITIWYEQCQRGQGWIATIELPGKVVWPLGRWTWDTKYAHHFETAQDVFDVLANLPFDNPYDSKRAQDWAEQFLCTADPEETVT